MKRLTFEGNFCDIAMCGEVRGGSFCEDGACSQRKIWERLKATEDILGDEYDLDRFRGLVKAYREERYIVLKEPRQAGVHRLSELAQADREGRCVVQDVKIGQKVWILDAGDYGDDDEAMAALRRYQEWKKRKLESESSDR